MKRSAEQLESAIAALQAQRALLGVEVADLALAPLRAELAALHAADEQQLRHVSVLFLDVVGSTALAEQLDTEDVQAVMDGALAAFTAAVQRRGGKVLQYAGDSLLAVFGAQEAGEDDGERAVLAGLDLLQEATTQTARVQARHGVAGFAVRVGVHSGGVLLGGGVDGERSIRGNTVNIAARMEQTAPAGALRISHDTWRLVRGLFDMDAQPPLPAKGREEPLLTGLVHGVIVSPRRGAQRGVDGVRTPLLGRDAQLQALQQAYTALCGPPPAATLQAVTVVAEAGLGKSRLLAEFDAWVATRPAGACRFEAHGAERRGGQPYGLLRELFTARLGLRDSDPADQARRTWLDAVTPLLGRRGDAAVLGHLLGLDFADEAEVHALHGDARLLRDRAFFHAAQLLRRAALPGPPVLVLLDDLHWADDGSLDFIEHLLQAHADLPLLLLALTRPALLARRPHWLQGAGHHRIDLPALDAGLSDSLLRLLLQRLPQVPDALAALIVDSADGNPFFIEELVNMLIDQGTILVQGPRWAVQPGHLQGLQVPGTLAGVLRARIDALPADERHALALAAVVGPVFWDHALTSLAPSAMAALPALVARDLVCLRERSSLAGMAEYSFRHHALHRVCYDSVLKRVKRPAHGLLARWLAAQPGPAMHAQIADHHERGGELVQARDAWHHAADAARSRFANAMALAHADRALALTGQHELVRRLQLTLLRLLVFGVMADRAQAADCLQALQTLADRLGDAGWRSEAAARRARFHFDHGEAALALAAAREAASLAPPDDKDRGARAEWVALIALNRLGRHDEGRGAAQAALRLAQEAGASQVVASVRNELGSVACDAGDMADAIAQYTQALAIHRADGHLANEGGTLCNLAFMALSVGDFAGAHAQFLQARALCERVGQRRSVGIIDINLGLALLHLGRAGDAQDHAERALALLRATGDRWAEAAALRVAGQAALALGQAAVAQRQFVASRDLFDALDLAHLALEAMASLAEEALLRGDVAGALGHAGQILARRARGVGLAGTDEPLRIPLITWQALHAAGDVRAPAVLDEARRELLARAGRIADAGYRQGYLQAVPYHRAILVAVAGGAPG